MRIRGRPYTHDPPSRTDSAPVFTAALAADDQLAVAVAAIKALTSVIVASKSETIMGLEIELSRASDSLRRCNPTSISLSAGCELFMRCGVRDLPAQEK